MTIRSRMTVKRFSFLITVFSHLIFFDLRQRVRYPCASRESQVHYHLYRPALNAFMYVFSDPCTSSMGAGRRAYSPEPIVR